MPAASVNFGAGVSNVAAFILAIGVIAALDHGPAVGGRCGQVRRGKAESRRGRA